MVIAKMRQLSSKKVRRAAHQGVAGVFDSCYKV